MGFTFLIVGKNHKGNNIRKIRKLYEIEISVFINKVWLENSHVCLAILYDFFFFFFCGAGEGCFPGKESTCQCRRHRFNPWAGKIPLEEEMATHCSLLAWEIPWKEEPGGLQSTGSQRVRHDWVRLSNMAASVHKCRAEPVRWGPSGAQTQNIYHLSLCRKKNLLTLLSGETNSKPYCRKFTIKFMF